jgi:hypothetical protein
MGQFSGTGVGGKANGLRAEAEGLLYYAYACGTHPSARRHGVLEEDIAHAFSYRIVADFLDDEPERWLVIGPNPGRNFLELVVLTTAEGGQLVIHAMPLRPKYRRLLEP